MEEFFKVDNFNNIENSEYLFAQNHLSKSVFDFFYQKGTKKIIGEGIKQNTIVYNLEKEEPSFIGYSFSIEQKERLYHYFGKSRFDNLLNEQNPQFNAIKKQIDLIDKIIEPVLNDLGIEYQLYLAGGALRDHILNKPIKDLDILIEFHDTLQAENQIGNNSSERSKNQQTALEKFFIEKSSIIKKHGLNIFHGQSREKILHEIIFQTINKQKDTNIKDFFWEKLNSEEKEIEKKQKQNAKEITQDDSLIYDGLFSVLKVEHASFTYPVDLLLNSNVFSYLNHFDFEICKCKYLFKALKTNTEIAPLYLKEVDPLYLFPGFIHDVINSTLSLNTQIFFSEKQVDRCLKDHYLRLKKKYPEYQMNLLKTEEPSKMIDYIEKAHKYFVLEDRLKPKEIKTKVKKI